MLCVFNYLFRERREIEPAQIILRALLNAPILTAAVGVGCAYSRECRACFSWKLASLVFAWCKTNLCMSNSQHWWDICVNSWHYFSSDANGLSIASQWFIICFSVDWIAIGPGLVLNTVNVDQDVSKKLCKLYSCDKTAQRKCPEHLVSL